mmetsp:Transcript_49804/g.161052  ORF Transcript_49804/g.161052 Transcript_49804/m.161052 type:complete len:341 (+) Transcript_49804:453-1475(+)
MRSESTYSWAMDLIFLGSAWAAAPEPLTAMVHCGRGMCQPAASAEANTAMATAAKVFIVLEEEGGRWLRRRGSSVVWLCRDVGGRAQPPFFLSDGAAWQRRRGQRMGTRKVQPQCHQLPQQSMPQQFAPQQYAAQQCAAPQQYAPQQQYAQQSQQPHQQQQQQEQHQQQQHLQPTAHQVGGGWQSVWSAEQQRYYFHHILSGITQWEVPGVSSSAASAAALFANVAAQSAQSAAPAAAAAASVSVQAPCVAAASAQVPAVGQPAFGAQSAVASTAAAAAALAATQASGTTSTGLPAQLSGRLRPRRWIAERSLRGAPDADADFGICKFGGNCARTTGVAG